MSVDAIFVVFRVSYNLSVTFGLHCRHPIPSSEPCICHPPKVTKEHLAYVVPVSQFPLR